MRLKLITETSFWMLHELLDTADNARGGGEDRFYYDILYALHEQLRVLSHRAQVSEQR